MTKLKPNNIELFLFLISFNKTYRAMTDNKYISLSDDWLTEGLVDLEFKQYKLLAYLQSVDEKFKSKRLYPPFADIIFHYKNLLKFKENNETLIRNFPKNVSALDLKRLALQYESKFEDPEFMEELKKIVEFAEPKLGNKIREGKELYDEIESQILIEPIGLCPINQNEGYFLVNIANDPNVHVFEYQISIFDSADSKYRGIHTNYLQRIKKSISNTFESIKMGLIREYKKLPNPATFIIDSKAYAPLNETLLPISKRLLVQKISA